MANILAEPEKWSDWNSNSPPQIWDAERRAYVESYEDSQAGALGFQLDGDFASGDVVSGCILQRNADGLDLDLVLVASYSEWQDVLGRAAATHGEDVQFEFPMPESAGGFIELLLVSPGTTHVVYAYGLQATIDPYCGGGSTCNFNCECDDPNPSRTLAELRTELMRRLGFSAMTASPSPGMPELLDSFLQGAQRHLYRTYPVLRTERFFTWQMQQGVRFYDLSENEDACVKKLDPRMLSWVGISEDCDVWRPLTCGIPPECYQDAQHQGIPYRYDIRQCIEVWPAPQSDLYKLRIKGDFGLEPFEEDEDRCTIDDEAVFLFALARAKAHHGQPDAANYQQDAVQYIRNLTAGAHLTRRYVPGEPVPPAWPKPIWTPKVYP